jgi:hypothetical protein
MLKLLNIKFIIIRLNLVVIIIVIKMINYIFYIDDYYLLYIFKFLYNK